MHGRNALLAIVSLAIVACVHPASVIVLITLIVINYLLSCSHRRYALILGMIVDIAALAGFKVYTQFIDTDIRFPIGLSYYSFSLIAYLADIYRERITPETSIIDFTAYIAMFPKLLEGPITRYTQLSDDLHHPKLSLANVSAGAQRVVLGLSMKVLVADRLGLLWNDICQIGADSLSTPHAWLGAIAYAIRLYLDFWGYSLMAQGAGQMLGLHIPDNFNQPYSARSIGDFYHRWHMTLTSWFRDYVYIPLGGNRHGVLRTVLNMLIVWLLTGLWHGIGPGYLIWGAMIWLFIAGERLAKPLTARIPDRLPMRILSHIYVIAVIIISWVIFAIPDMSELRAYLSGMFGNTYRVNVYAGDFIEAISNYWEALAAGIVLCLPVSQKIYKRIKGSLAVQVILAFLLWVCVWRIGVSHANPFMYANF